MINEITIDGVILFLFLCIEKPASTITINKLTSISSNL